MEKYEPTGTISACAPYQNKAYKPTGLIISLAPNKQNIDAKRVPWPKLWWQAKSENDDLKKKIETQAHQLGNQGYRIHNQRKEIERQAAQNAELKELLMQSRIYVKIDTEDYEDRTVSKAEKAEARKLLTKIDEVLK
jgi:hypothetical protein